MKKKTVSAADFDFKLLVIFNEVYKYSSVSRAAEALDCSPPFVSQSLQKLRVFFSDPLFVRNGQRLTPTTVAETIYLQLSKQYIGMLNTLESLAASTSKDLLVIHCATYLATRIVPWVVQWAEVHAPECKIIHRDFLRAQDTSEDLLLQRGVDLVFDALPVFNSSLCTVPLLEDAISLFCREDHPRLGSQISAAEAKLEKFSVLDTNGLGVQIEQVNVEKQLGDRQVRYNSYSLYSIAAVVAQTDTVGILPTWLFERSKKIYPIRELKTEFKLNTVPIYMMYSKVSLQNDTFSSLANWLEKEFPKKNL